MLRDERGGHVEVDESSTLDWDTLRARIKQHGMRNSNCIAIAPTATISNIIGVSACIEPTFQNLYVKSNLSGEFTVVNDYLVRDLKKLGLWDEVMVADLVLRRQPVPHRSRTFRTPRTLRHRVRSRTELVGGMRVASPEVDRSGPVAEHLHGRRIGQETRRHHKLAWKRGLKTTYYLRTLGATSAEKSTGRGGERTPSAGANPPPRLWPLHLFCRNPKFSGRFAPCGRAIPVEECEACQ